MSKPLVHYEVRGKTGDNTTICLVNDSGVAFDNLGRIWPKVGKRDELERLVRLANTQLGYEPHETLAC